MLVGRAKERVDLSALDAEPNVHRLGYRPFDELPALLGHFDVCIAPYRLDALTHASLSVLAVVIVRNGGSRQCLFGALQVVHVGFGMHANPEEP